MLRHIRHSVSTSISAKDDGEERRERDEGGANVACLLAIMRGLRLVVRALEESRVLRTRNKD